MKRVFKNQPWPRYAAAALSMSAILVLGWITINGLRERYAALAELGEQRQRLTQALAMRDTGNQALLDIRRRLEPLPAEVPAQQDAMSLLRAFWAETGHPPPLELKLQRPEARWALRAFLFSRSRLGRGLRTNSSTLSFSRLKHVETSSGSRDCR